MFSWQEWIGYLASTLVAISLLMSSVKRLRWINMIGSFVFAVYGLIIFSIPVLLMNTFLVFVNLWFLIRLKQNKSSLIHLKHEDWSDPLVRKFMCKNHKNLQLHFPKFDYKTSDTDLFLIFSEFEIAGFIAGKVNAISLEIDAIYVVPKYKDFALHEKLFENNRLALRVFNAEVYEFKIESENTRKYLEKYAFIH